MINKNVIDLYLNDGFDLTLVNGKRPILKNWTTDIPSDADIRAHKGNLGWVIDQHHLVIDVDPRSGGDVSFKKLCKFLGEDLEPDILTPSGGFHIYTKLPTNYVGCSLKKTVSDFKGIDFLTAGTQCVIAGSITEKGDYKFYDDLTESYFIKNTPMKLLKILKNDKITKDYSVTDDVENFLKKQNVNKWPRDKVEEKIYLLDPSMTYNDWLKVGMALHDWDQNEGLDIWEKWSSSGLNYEDGATAKKWASFRNCSEVTIGTIDYMARESVFDKNKNKIEKYLDLIEKSNGEKSLQFEICPKIKKENFEKIDSEILAKAIQRRYKQLRNVTIPIATVRDMIGANKQDVVSGTFIDDIEDTPQWCNDWIWVDSNNAYYNLKSMTFNKQTTFNATCGRFVPYTEGTNTKPSATKYISDNGYIEVVNATAYIPYIENQIVTINGVKVLNTFNKKTVPDEASEYSDEGLKAVRMVKKHIDFICSGDDKNVKVLTSWLAHNVQHPGKKILWSPIIQSIQGIGKTVFSEILRACLGDINVGTVSPTQVISDFNGWATNRCVNILEELRIQGKNRHDCVNSLKPLITDRIIQINDKGVSQYNTTNTCNYICFTNYKDAIPLEESDRRWWVINVEIDSLDEMSESIGEDVKTYFPKLFNCAREYGAELRKFFLDYEISDEFLNTNQAPMTKYKKSMIVNEKTKTEGFIEIEELLKKGSDLYNEQVLSSCDLFNDLLMEYPEICQLNNWAKNNLLKKMGYQFIGRIKIKGQNKRIWAKKIITSDEARVLLSNEKAVDIPF